MKLALLSDIHANLQAFDACLAHAQAVGAQRYALLGDLVGYGADPVAVVQRVIQMAGEGAIVLKGNHDEMAVMPDGANKTLGGSTADWTHAQLDAAQRAYLDALPLTHREDTTLLVHASVDSPGRWRYVDDERSAGASLDACADQPGVHYVFGGHVHQQMLYYRCPCPGIANGWPPSAPWASRGTATREPCTPCSTCPRPRSLFTACPMTTNRLRPPSGRPDCPNTLPNAWRMDVETAGTWSRTGRICH